MKSWSLAPLLTLRRHRERQAMAGLGRALAGWRAAEDEAGALELALHGARLRALEGRPGGAGERWRARLRLEADRLEGVASVARARASVEAAELEARRARLGEAARRRQQLERLEAAWRKRLAVEAARREEAALDDRAWSAEAARPLSAGHPAGWRRAPAGTAP
jgi:flagellar biosynthesis chaperone FliJ